MSGFMASNITNTVASWCKVLILYKCMLPFVQKLLTSVLAAFMLDKAQFVFQQVV